MRGEFAGFYGLSVGGKGAAGEGREGRLLGEKRFGKLSGELALWMVKRNDRRWREMV